MIADINGGTPWHTSQTSEANGRWSLVWEWDKVETPDSKPLISNPSVAQDLDVRIELIVRSSNKNHYRKWQTSKNSNGKWDWSDWTRMY
jgi:hypothetical protein